MFHKEDLASDFPPVGGSSQKLRYSALTFILAVKEHNNQV